MVSKIDRKILEMLQEDARTPLTKIADAVNMSENGIKYRLEKLERNNVIKRMTLTINPSKVGMKITALFDLDIEPSEMLNCIRKMKKRDEFTKIYHTTGDHSVFAIGLFEDHEDLTNFLNNVLLKEFPINNFSLNIVMKKYKDSIFEI